MAFCQSFMTELYRHIGADTDVPAGDIGVGAREIGYLFGQYKRIRNCYEGVLTGKGLTYGGSLARTEATGYGLLYFTRRDAEEERHGYEGQDRCDFRRRQRGNLCHRKGYSSWAQRLSPCPIPPAGSTTPRALTWQLSRRSRRSSAQRLSEYTKYRPNAEYHEGKGVLERLTCDIALPCATQNELNEEDAKMLVKNGVHRCGRGREYAHHHRGYQVYLSKHGVLFAPGKASNAGGVATSALEMSQNSERLSWTFEEVDAKLKGIMENIFAERRRGCREVRPSRRTMSWAQTSRAS